MFVFAELGCRSGVCWMQLELAAKHGLISNTPDSSDHQFSIAWGDFQRPGVERSERPYEEVTDYSKLLKLLEDYLDEYNISHTTTMNIGRLWQALWT